MKIFVYHLRDFDEKLYFDKICKELDIEYEGVDYAPTVQNAHLTQGCFAVDIITTPIDKYILDAFKANGVKLLISRTVGTDHIDKEYAKKIGIEVASITYSPNAVADYALMLMLMGLRKLKYIMMRSAGQDYGLVGRLAKEMHECTVGLLGGGAIGSQVAKSLIGFDCKIKILDRNKRADLENFVSYCDLDEILATCDIISIHLSGSEDNRHLIDAKALAKMKQGVILVNTARGLIIDTEALIDSIEAGHIGFAALDVIEDEIGRYYYDHTDKVLTNRQISILNAFPNAMVLPHMGFYTETAVRDMVVNSVIKIKEIMGNDKA